LPRLAASRSRRRSHPNTVARRPSSTSPTSEDGGHHADFAQPLDVHSDSSPSFACTNPRRSRVRVSPPPIRAFAHSFARPVSRVSLAFRVRTARDRSTPLVSSSHTLPSPTRVPSNPRALPPIDSPRSTRRELVYDVVPRSRRVPRRHTRRIKTPLHRTTRRTTHARIVSPRSGHHRVRVDAFPPRFRSPSRHPSQPLRAHVAFGFSRATRPVRRFTRAFTFTCTFTFTRTRTVRLTKHHRLARATRRARRHRIHGHRTVDRSRRAHPRHPDGRGRQKVFYDARARKRGVHEGSVSVLPVVGFGRMVCATVVYVLYTYARKFIDDSRVRTIGRPPRDIHRE